MTPAPLVTTSWDDGHPLDLRVAGVLARHGLRGTFYVPVQPVAGGLLSTGEMRTLLDMGMEIGSHTVTHPVLTEISEAEVDRELRDSRSALEDALGVEVTSFCYPKGRFNDNVVQRTKLAGYRVGRTTVGFQTGRDFDPLRMPVSVQLFPHGPSIHCRHAIKQGNWQGLRNWLFQMGAESDVEMLTARLMERISAQGGIFHLWGHSWELEKHGLWPLFERVAATMGNAPAAVHVTNRQTVKDVFQ
jgi:hypothetical protein